MNFQSLANVDNADFYIDVAFRRGKEAGDIKRSKTRGTTRTKKSKDIELAKVKAVKQSLLKSLDRITKSFPNMDDLTEFYIELIKCTLDYRRMKKALGAVNWAGSKICSLYSKYSLMIKKDNLPDIFNKHRKDFYGRVSSVMKQINSDLEYLEYCRKRMRSYPAIKTATKTFAIVGFPNVGKTTLLFKLTGSKPEIASYAFTTKGINVGYIKTKKRKIQLVDTPGSLDRFDKMNSIEQQADLVMKLVADKIIYVFDITEPFPMQKQVDLYKKVKRLDKEVIVYISKADIVDIEKIKRFAKKYSAFFDPDKLRDLIEK